MTATPEERALAEDVTTPAATLQELAAAHRELWPAIAAHPNVYPDLLAWMQEHGTPTVPANAAPVAAGPEAVAAGPAPVATAPASEASTPRAPGVPRGRLFAWIGGGAAAVVLAIVLVIALVVTPMQRAAEEAAAAEAEAEALRTSLVTSFENAAKDCTQANSDYTSALSQANTQLTADPGSLADPTTLDALRERLAELDDVEPCVAATQPAHDNDELTQQTSGIRSEVVRVQTATTALNTAATAVRQSGQDKANEAALAAAEQQRQQEAAKLAASTWTMKDAQGYSFTASLTASARTTKFTTGDYTLGDACGFDPATDMAVPVTLTVTGTTEGFDTSISAGVRIVVERASTPHEVAVESYFSDAAKCQTAIANGKLIDWLVNWSSPFATGTSGTHRFVVIIRDWRTPATPNGDLAFLDSLMLTAIAAPKSGFSGEWRSLALSALQ